MEKEPSEISVYKRMLYYTASCGYVSRKYLLALSDSDTYVYREISTALKKGHLQKYTAMESINYRRKKDIYYGITAYGLSYLASVAHQLPVEMQWVKYLDAARPSFSEKKTRALSAHRRMLRYLSITGAAVMAAIAGGSVGVVRLHSDREVREENEWDLLGKVPVEDTWVDYFAERNLLSEETELGPENVACWAMERAAEMEPEQNPNGIFQNKDGSFRFINAYEMKRRIQQSDQRISAVYYARFTGLMESPLKTVLVYTGQRDGMSWSGWIVRMDQQTQRLYECLAYPDRYDPRGKKRGMVFVKNAKMFYDLFWDKGNKGRGEQFGEGFDTFLVLPENAVGAVQLRQYMTVDMETYQDRFVRAALASSLYSSNPGAFANVFPLVNRNGTEMAIGTFLDTMQIYRILSIQDHRTTPFGIICYEWQKEYYSRVFPERTQYMIVE